jgi:hypothetical protein
MTGVGGVLRGGAYGPGLNSLLNPLRGDAVVEEAMRGLQVPARPVQTPPQLDLGLTRDECFLIWQEMKQDCRNRLDACVTAILGAAATIVAACAVVCLNPVTVTACAKCLKVGIGVALAVITCFGLDWFCRRGADRWRDACLREAAPPAIALPATAPPGSTGGNWI